MALTSVLVLHTPGVPAPPPLSRNVDCSYGRALFGAFLVSLLRVWLESGIPPTLSVVGVRSTLSPPLWFSALVGIRVQPVLQRINDTEIFASQVAL